MIPAQELVERILAASAADECVVIVHETTEANLRWAGNTLTTNGVMSGREVTVIAFVAVGEGMASGSVSRSDVALDEIADVAQEARRAALAAGPAPDAAPLARDIAHGAWTSPHEGTSPEVFSRIAPELGEMFQRAQSDGIELFGYAEHTSRTTWLGSTGGLRLRHDQPAGRLEMTGKSHGRSRSTWEGRATRDFVDLSMQDVDAGIRQRLDWQGRTVDLPAGRYDTVMPPGAVADLLTYAFWTMGAKEAHEGQSVFSRPGGGTRVGERLASVPVAMYGDPAHPGLECAPFLTVPAGNEMASTFDNGLATPHVDWMRDGVLTSLIGSRSSANEAGLAFTPLVDNLIVEVPGGTGSTDDLVAATQDGLLVTTLWYIRMVDPITLLLTGLTRDGVYRVEGGEVVGAVTNFRWNESPVDLLHRITGHGASEIAQPREWADYVHRVAAPAMRFSGFNMSTVSQAN